MEPTLRGPVYQRSVRAEVAVDAPWLDFSMPVPPPTFGVNAKWRKIVAVEPLHLDTLGYGPEGKLTRRQWRDICWDKLRDPGLNAQEYERWQTNLKGGTVPATEKVSFALRVTFDDQQTVTLLDGPDSLLLPDTVDVSGQHFDIPLTLRGFRFSRGSAFLCAATLFASHVDFSGAEWQVEAEFQQARFIGGANFQGVRFLRGTWFQRACFEQDVDLSRVQSQAHMSLSACFFGGQAIFDSARFHSRVNFDETTFRRLTTFNKARFSGPATFSRTRFRELVRFDDAKFNEEASFDSAVFEKAAEFPRATFSQDARFVRCTFCGFTKFENTNFENVGYFEYAKFLNDSPSFHAVKHQTILLFSGVDQFPDSDVSADAIKRYEVLKQLSEAQGQTEQALNFNALELRARRHQPTAGHAFRVATWLYERLSDYGRSFARPLGAYAALVLLTFCLALSHAAFHSPTSCPGEPKWRILSDLLRDDHPCVQDAMTTSTLYLSGYRAAGEYAVYRAAGVLDFADNDKQTEAIHRRLFREPIEPWWMRIYGVFKAIASTALLFLTALGLRNQYRLK